MEIEPLDVLIVYHEPGVASSVALLESLSSALRARGLRHGLIPLKSVARGRCRARRVVLLLFARGGHWLEVREACGTEVHVIPPSVTALAVREAVGSTTRRLLLLYRRSKRLVDVHESDIGRIARSLRALGYGVETATPEDAEGKITKGLTIVPLSLLPGSLTETAYKLAKAHSLSSLPAFAEYGLPYLAAWIAGLE